MRVTRPTVGEKITTPADDSPTGKAITAVVTSWQWQVGKFRGSFSTIVPLHLVEITNGG